MSAAEAQKTELESALVGAVIARKFRLVRLLGVGGMGSVYEAQDLLLGRRVALKLMRREIASSHALVQRFVREARAADSIQHKNIVRVLDLASDDETGQFYIVQELLSGESLADRLDRERALSPKDTVEIMGPVLDALAAAHERGIVHRDVKPENVFLHREGGAIVPKLIDFGISKVLQSDEGGAGLSKTQTGTALGTPYYMSPEQVRGDSNIDHRADQWSAGVMLFELLTGRRPFQGENYNLLILKIMTDRAPRADEVSISVPTALATVIARALEPERAQRFASTRELREALDRAIEETPHKQLAQVSHSDSHVALRADAPTMGADELGQSAAGDPAPTDARAVAPTMVATDEPSAPALPSVSERPSTVSHKQPTRPVVLLGAVLAAAVSVAAVVGVARARPVAQTERVSRPVEAPRVQPPPNPARVETNGAAETRHETSIVAAGLTADAGVRVSAPTSPTVNVTRTRVRPVNPRVVQPGASGAETPTTPSNAPRTIPVAGSTTSPPDNGATAPARPVGFVPVTSY
ncbi:MAG: protein kinase [Myxococcales bacterium]|nr:protein kinase [Myxococcales bacterium]